VKTRIVDPTESVAEATTAATAPHRDARCETCGHAIGAHFTSPDCCQFPSCPCAGYVSSDQLKLPLVSLGRPPLRR
jgi:hypothetical protein